jgi:putative DNA primase/helicase
VNPNAGVSARGALQSVTWLTPIPAAISARLRERDQWLVWRGERRDGRMTKVPYTAERRPRAASSTDPATWRPFWDAVAACCWDELRLDGIGYALTEADGVVGIDLDHCRDHDSGVIEAWALDIVQRIGSYTEVSPSGTGLRIIALGTLPTGRRKKRNVEMYDRGRYLTMTGHRVSGSLE